jgi:hydrogenase expression/formation protein HypC
MCLAIPSKVIKIDGVWAKVEGEGHAHQVNLSLLKDVKKGDYLLIHADLAINKIPVPEARRILKMTQNLASH